MYEASEQMRCSVYGRVDAEGRALVRGAGEEVDKRVSSVVPEFRDLSSCQRWYDILRTAADYLFAVQQECQVVWHLALVSDDPCQRARIALWCSRRSVYSLNAAGWAAKETALPAQLLQFALGWV